MSDRYKLFLGSRRSQTLVTANENSAAADRFGMYSIKLCSASDEKGARNDVIYNIMYITAYESSPPISLNVSPSRGKVVFIFTSAASS